MLCDNFLPTAEDEDEFVCTQLDTIVEVEEASDEDEENEASGEEATSERRPNFGGEKFAQSCDRIEIERLDIEQAGNVRVEYHQQVDTVDVSAEDLPPRSSSRPQAEKAKQQQQQPVASAVENDENKCDTPIASARRNNKMKQSLQIPVSANSTVHLQVPQPLVATLPSTNRLISEHQARQQQALFKALAARQKLADKAAPSSRSRRKRSRQVDKSSGKNLARSGKSNQSDQTSRYCSPGIPLSSVDLSSMPDGMLDELLGHIASASSSSSLSSTADSLDSSERLSDESTSDSDEAASGGRAGAWSWSHGSPNVIGVHEEGKKQQQQQQVSSSTGGSSKLERYFTSGLVEPHHFHSSSDELFSTADTIDYQAGGTEEPSTGEESGRVEEVLGRMLSALERIDDSEPVEQLNGLLEQGFAHLERLLNCNLATGNGTLASTNSSAASSTGPSGAFPARAQQKPMISGNAMGSQQQQQQQQQLPLSKDSDYGSDTQSADCLAQFSDTGGLQPQQQLRIQSNLQASESSSRASNTPGGINGQTLSPLAIELSIKLAESLHRLAQQQAARRAIISEEQQDDERSDALSPAEASSPTGKQRKSSVILINGNNNNNNTQQYELEQSHSQQSHSPAECSQSSSLNNNTSQSTCSSPQQQLQRQHAIRDTSNLTPMHGEGDSSSSSSSPFASETERNKLEDTQQTETKLIHTSSNAITKAARRPQFRTRVNLGTGQVSSVIVAPSSADETSVVVQSTISTPQVQIGAESAFSSYNNQENTIASSKAGSQVIKVQAAAAAAVDNSGPPGMLERHRSARNSLRRRGSFGGPRPGSPLPRGILEQVAASQQQQLQAQEVSSASSPQHLKANQQEQPGEVVENERHQKQLQRALVIAQKYNYSPAKLAASKLSAKLQLKDLYSESSDAINGTASAKRAVQELNGLASGEQNVTAKQQQVASFCVSGQIQLDISYFARSGSLTVHVMQCTHLAPVSKRRTTSNPYVKLYLLPDKTKSGKRKSSIHRSQLNPKFDEKFTFGPLQFSEFDSKILSLSVWHKDRLGRNEFLGEVLLPLTQVRKQLLTSDLCQSTGPKWYQLCDRPLDDSLTLASGNVGKQQRQEQLAGKQELFCYRYQSDSTGTPSSTTTTENSNDNSQVSFVTQKTTTHKQTSATSKELEHQAELVHRLGELQLKAARLTSTVAPSSVPVPRHSGMNVSLGPIVRSAGANQQAPITGQLFVALKFVPEGSEKLKLLNSPRALAIAEGELHVMIKEAHNICGFVNAPQVAPPSGSLPNPYCKCYLLASNGQRIGKQKTAHLKRTVNPRWDHKCVFDSVKLSQLASQAVEIHMFNRDSILVSNDYLGGIRLCRATSIQQQQQQQQQLHEQQQVADSSSIASSEQSAGGDATTGSGTSSLRRSFSRQDSSASKGEDENALCSERESRLWNQMLARPNIWVYGELKLMHLRPLLANSNQNIHHH